MFVQTNVYTQVTTKNARAIELATVNGHGKMLVQTNINTKRKEYLSLYTRACKHSLKNAGL